MPARVILRTYTNQAVAEVMATRLRELDLPIVVMRSARPEAYFGAGGEFEVWLEDDSILENETWRGQIEEVLASDSEGLTPEEEEAIANMPLVDTVREDPQKDLPISD
jgi:hypothetical protein